MAATFDLQSPASRRLLDATDARAGLATGKRELVQVCGDAEDPGGISTTYHLNRSAVAHPVVIYKDAILTLDVYAVPDEAVKVHMYCPRCKHALSIPGDKKRIDLDMRRDPHGEVLVPSDADLAKIAELRLASVVQAFGKISIEPFECTWELTNERGLFGVTLCRWKVAIDNNICKDA